MKLEQTFHKKPIFHDVEQGTDDWIEPRLGMITASKMSEVKSSGAGRLTYMRKLIGEKLTGKPAKGYSGKWTEYGHEYEPQALACHELEQGLTIRRVGFVEFSSDLGFSPDGLIDDDGMVEAKCRSPHVQIETIECGKPPPDVKWQIQFSLWGLGLNWCDYVSFSPFMKTSARYWYKKVPRDPIVITEIRTAVTNFLNEMASREAALNNGSAIASRELLK